ncbi:bifunctional riboflavin kinase/FAD synthetase [Halanaerobium sp. MA284_MarDTE_T2]|uniref:bifunctional riboflavin kinase/FAD synthetase n=1 Tax=Halanaerobium sp. MA284_MarDTE_T2 TaxID=2183913 RepID=UPI000DF11B52|nr:bifunctional riboflavin kinase/FAD synthetase [Halanaerobium sp. MA284_MarDTE_T2]RCW51561.1 riboflavin kinase/FMN adenylyltransferase [Halanaerobium sp. MA284_MarDTE_T2]
MKVITNHNFKNYNKKNTYLAIGVFDGLHKGHKLIINKTVENAKINRGVSGVFSFYPHPLKIISGQNIPSAIISRQQKINILEKLNVDYYFEQEFTPRFAQLEAEEFVKKVLVKNLNVSCVVVGEDFRFGHLNRGNVEVLKKMGEIYSFDTKIISQLNANNDRISSTKIRKLIQKGHLTKAENLLGRPYQICGKVHHGKKRGRKMGVPTANISLETNYSLPPAGVYAVKVYINDKTYAGAANLGFNPTFKEKNINFEINILDFNKTIYNKRICADFVEFIRPEIKFDSRNDLIEQMKEDILYTRNLLC